MPLTLFRYILSDLVRAMLLTTAVLVTVIAFGAAIKPLTHDQLPNAIQAAKYIMLACVPMLQFALPFSAGFAATLTMHRMANDNEILAMAVGGISYRKILVPVISLGVALLLIMLVLTQWVIPQFWGLMQRTIAMDITRVFEASIRRHEPFMVGNLQIYADDVVVREQPEDSEADARMVLVRGAAAELDDDGRIVTDVTFHQCVIDIYRRPAGLVLKLAMADAVVFDGKTGGMLRSDRVEPGEIPIPHVLDDELPTKTVGELRRLRVDPDRHGKVARAKLALADAMRDATILEAIDATLREVSTITLVQRGPDDRSYRLDAGRISRGLVMPVRGGSIEVTEYRGETPIRRFVVESGKFERSRSQVITSPEFDLVLQACEVTDLAGDGFTNTRPGIVLQRLILPGVSDQKLEALDSATLIERSVVHPRQTAALRQKLADLERAIHELNLEIGSQLGLRTALALTAPLLLGLGATLAMWRRESLPLIIYLLAFLPSIADLIVITGGDHMVREGNPLGWLVMWCGNAVLLACWVYAYLRLARN